MGLGFQGAMGIQGGMHALDQLLANRIAQAEAQRLAEQQQIENEMKQRQMAQGDRRLDLEEAQANKTAEPRPMVVGDSLVSPTGGVLYAAPQKPTAPRGPYVVGGNLVDDKGGVLYTAPKDAPKNEFAEWKQKYDYEIAHPKNAPGPTSATSAYQQERETRNLQSIDELSKKVNRWTTGVGSLLARIPETDARNFAAELDTLKANIAFSELTAMREASKTGGALGQVSDKEGALLQASLGALDAGQSPSNIKAQLDKIKASIQRWQQARSAQGAPAGATATPAAKPTAADLIKKYGGR